MSRRPPGQVALPGKWRNLALVAALIFPWQAVGQAPQQQIRQSPSQQEPQQLSTAPEGDNVATFLSSGFRPTTALTGEKVTETRVDTPPSYDRRKNTHTSVPEGAVDDRFSRGGYLFKDENKNINSDDASAYHALDDISVGAPSLPRHKGPGGSLTQQPISARNLEDWDVEDFVLLATVDGDLYAADRSDGRTRWSVQMAYPMVETKHFRTNVSELDDDYDPIDHWIWVVEPIRDGGLYIWAPHGRSGNPALIEMPWTIKQMLALTPYADKEQDIIYTGKQETTMVTIDAATGGVLKLFNGSTGEHYINEESCLRPTALAGMDEDKCSKFGTITLGRTEYTLNIRHERSGHRIAELKYSEWVPNIRDIDLMQKYNKPKDHKYITTRHDGQVVGFSMDQDYHDAERPIFAQALGSPVARVFDVLRRWDESRGSNPDLTVLPQPPLPFPSINNKQVLVNQTNQGSLYAMSDVRYPLIREAPTAPIHTKEWWRYSQSWDKLNTAQISKALVGTHPLPTDDAEQPISKPLLTLPAPLTREEPVVDSNESMIPTIPPPPEESTLLTQAKRLPEFAAYKVLDLISNPILLLAFAGFLFSFRQDIIRWCKRQQKEGGFLKITSPTIGLTSPTLDEQEKVASEDEIERNPDKDAAVPQETTQRPGENAAVNVESPIEKETENPGAEKQSPSPTVTIVEPDEVLADGAKKKKAHRGRRGGIKHRKGQARRELSQSRDDDPPEATVEEVINKAKNLGPQPRLEPDIQTVTNDVEEISGPILRMGSLEVDEDKQLGTGSNGTVVFAGKWEGRDVAVKRMLIQFTEIASHETKLLQESDDHANVIRYFAQQQRAAFLYIALELCQASLADVVQKPAQYRELALAGKRDMQGILLQVANGLKHLHSLRIVHRDLKPQNILVTMSKDGRPRMLVSDFGLCKKLEGTNSSFGATTAHAAGTSGWRAPELLLDDHTPAGSGSIGLATADPGSSSLQSGDVEQVGVHNRRVTRAIDIFSLGLVFFYVLTEGNHPFDCGDRYMREVNIRKGKYSLQALDVLGDFAYEAKDLISSMLDSNPRRRPAARDVMAHPFFWSAKKRLSFLCDVSDHFEKEPREPPSPALRELERHAEDVVRADFLRHLTKDFVDSLGKQRKYTGGRLLDLLRALRNKRNHYEDMSDSLKKAVGPLPDGYLGYWTRRFPNLLITCWNVVYDLHWEETDRFREYYEPAML